MKKKELFFIINTFFFIFFSCSPEKSSVPKIENSKLQWLFVFYFSADSNLEKYALADLKELEKAGTFSKSYSATDKEMKIIAYIDFKESFNRHPLVFEISPNGDNKINSSIIKTYPEQNSSDVNRLRTTLDFIKQKYPSEKIALFLSSHSNGWLPTKQYKNAEKGEVQLSQTVQNKINSLSKQNQNIVENLSKKKSYENSKEIIFKGFSLDESSDNNEMDIFELANIFQDNELEMIAFDSCSMADIEIFYQLKDKTKYIVASQSEILGYGYPYEIIFKKVMEQLQQKNLATENLVKIITAEVYHFYNNHENPLYRSVSISSIKTDKISILAKEINNFYQKVNKFSNNKITDLITQENFTNTSFGNDYSIFKYDLKSFLGKINRKTINENFSTLEKIWQQVVIANNHTEKFLIKHKMDYFHGINIYIPYQEITGLWNYYKNYRWVTDTNYEILLD